MRSLYLVPVAGLAILLSVSAGATEAPLPMDDAFELAVSRAAQGVTLKWDIAPGYYLYRDYVAVRDEQGNKINVTLPEGDLKDDPGFGAVAVFHDSLSTTLQTPPARLQITYQGCQEGGLCYPPSTKEIDTSALTISATAPVLPGSGPSDQQRQSDVKAADSAVPAFNLAGDASVTSIDRLMSDGGLLLVLAGFMGFGVLLAFTPCVFPMYPIVAAMLSREGERLTPVRGFVLSSSYVVSLGVAFGLFGMVAAWSGQNLQIALQSPITTAAVAVLFVLLALSNFGAFQIQLPDRLRRIVFSQTDRTGSIGGAMAMGFSSALLIGPCVTAPLAGALIYIARTGDVLIGALALFALGVGKGVPLVLMSTLGGSILPRAGAWMEQVRTLFGFLFLATAIYVATPLLYDRMVLLLWALLALPFGVLLGAFERSTNALMRSMAVVSFLWGGLMLTGFALGATDPLEPLAPLKSSTSPNSSRPIDNSDFTTLTSAAELSNLLDRSARDGQPTLLYVTADWCITCRGIERNLLPDLAVARELRTAGLATLDVSQIDDQRRTLMEALDVVGPPTMLFFDAERREVNGTRLVGDFSVPDFLAAAARARGDKR